MKYLLAVPMVLIALAFWWNWRSARRDRAMNAMLEEAMARKSAHERARINLSGLPQDDGEDEEPFTARPHTIMTESDMRAGDRWDRSFHD